MDSCIIRLIRWIIKRFYASRYRLVSPRDLEVVVSDYLAELDKLGVRLTLARSKVGESDEQLSNSRSPLEEGRTPRV